MTSDIVCIIETVTVHIRSHWGTSSSHGIVIPELDPVDEMFTLNTIANHQPVYQCGFLSQYLGAVTRT